MCFIKKDDKPLVKFYRICLVPQPTPTQSAPPPGAGFDLLGAMGSAAPTQPIATPMMAPTVQSNTNSNNQNNVTRNVGSTWEKGNTGKELGSNFVEMTFC